MKIEEALNQIVDEVVEQVETGIQPASSECEPVPCGKSLSFDISIDGSGHGRYQTSVKGIAFVIKKKVSAVIKSPNGTFSIHVTTSAGTDEMFSNVKTGQEISCKLRIKNRTSIVIEVRSSVPNTTVKGSLSY